MRKVIFGIMTLSCVLIFVPSAPAQQQPLDRSNGLAVENLCDPDFNAPFAFSVDQEQLDRVRVELLERGFNPGFKPERDSATDKQLMDVVAQFQIQYELPVTGQIDGPTLAALSIPTLKANPSMSDQIERAKPTK